MSNAQSKAGTTHRDFLWVVLFFIIFVNGFESGGYQASLLSVGQTFDLSTTSMGIFAAVELLADMLAPIVLGSWADRTHKGTCIKIALAVQVVTTVVVVFAQTQGLFVGSMFLLGLTTSALQFISIALLADAYPATNKRRIGYMTSMYALGAVTAPLVVTFYLNVGIDWRALFVVLAVCSVIAFVCIARVGAEPREEAPRQEARISSGRFVLVGVLLICVVMCIYVGFENGFAFFVDTFFTNVFNDASGKLALSLYWFVMIPSRMLVGRFSNHAPKILLASVITIPVVALLVAVAPTAWMVMLLCIPLGLASGAIYPCSLTMALPFAGKKTATATGMITTATGIGGFLFTAYTGFAADMWDVRTAIASLAAFFIISLGAVLAVNRLSASIARENKLPEADKAA